MARISLLHDYPVKIGLRVPTDLAARIIVDARTRKVPESVIVVEALREFWKMRDKTKPKNQGHGGSDKVVQPKPESLDSSVEAIPKANQTAEGNSFTFETLKKAISDHGGKHSELAAYLGLQNVSIWNKSGVPEKWFPQITEYLIGIGWVPPDRGVQPEIPFSE